MDKSSWGPGPWQTEPDRLQWTDPVTGLVCLIKRNPLGALCGYVGIPPGHRYHGADYGEPDVRVHGGLTYAAACEGDPPEGICHKPAPGEPDDFWWLGFDCAHAGDVCPKVGADLKHTGYDMKRRLIGLGVEDEYRDIDYVRRECERLAAQLSSAHRATPGTIGRELR